MDNGAGAGEVAVVLVEPREAGNIGAAARAMANMGLERLLLVRPVPHLAPAAFRMALSARGILERAEVHEDLADALAGFGFVAGTTRRGGKGRRGRTSPRTAAARIVREAKASPCAIVFGREESGLTNGELELCHALVTIPSSPSFGSLNLAQAVLVFAYEIFLARREPESPRGAPKALAPVEHLEGLYAHAREVLLDIGYLHRENPARMMRVFRRIFARAGLDEVEVRALRGVFRQMDWYRRQAGLTACTAVPLNNTPAAGAPAQERKGRKGE